ncbi:MAG: hypothetical protein KGL63_04085 [Betaproteobacteria bacterium]|nr:hypothetical protein [Betaproteobacteria bacterium]
MAINISTTQVEVARFAGALYGLAIDNATMADVVSAVNANSLNTVLNNVYQSDWAATSDASVAATIVANLGITGTLATEATAYVQGQLDAAAAGTKGQTIMTILNTFAQLTSDATWGTAATAWENKISNAVDYAQNAANTSNELISNVSTSAAPTIYTLTTSPDTINAGSGPAVINANPVSGVNTLSALDSINGGTSGKSTLNVVDGATASNAAYALPAGVTVTNVQTANLTTNGSFGNTAGPTVFDISGWTGLTNANLVASGSLASDVKVADTTALTLAVNSSAGAVTTVAGGSADSVTAAGSDAVKVTGAGLTSVTIKGGGAVTVDNTGSTGTTAAGKTLTSVSINDDAGAAVKGQALDTLTLQGQGAGGTARTVTLTNGTSKALTINAAGTGFTTAGVSTPTVVTEAAATATSATVNTTAASSLDLSGITTLTTLNLAGAGDLTLANQGNTLTTVSAGTSSGVLTLGTLGTAVTAVTTGSGDASYTVSSTGAVTVTGGSGSDTVTLTSSLVKGSSINLGGGNNALLAGAGGGLTSTVTVDGGTGGTNTISAALVNAGDAANIKDFQILDVSGFGSGAGNGALDTGLMSTAISGVSITTAATSGTATLLNLGPNVTVTDSADNTSSALVLTHAATSGTLTVDFASSATTTAGATIISSLTSTGDTQVSISSAGTDANAVNTLTSLTETDNQLTKVVITGANAFTLGAVHTDSAASLTAATASTLTTIDASATTGGVTITAGGNDVVNTQNLTYNGLTILGGTGGDTIINHAKSGVITEGASASTVVNTLTVDGSGATINDGAAAGNDVIHLSGSNETATLGSGASTVSVAAGAAASNVDTVNLVSGAGAAVTDNVLYGAAAGNQTAATNYDLLVLGGTLHGNTLNFAAAIATTPGALGAATSIGAAQTFDQAVFVALGGTMGGGASTTTTAAINTVDWFQYGGNTYIVDAGGTAPGAGAASTAQVVKIAGVVDLSHATINASGAGITFA